MFAPGEGHVPSYQISATPYVTSSQIPNASTKQHSFPQVSRWFNIKNRATGSGVNLHVGFTQNGLAAAKSNFFILGPGESFEQELRVTTLFLSNSSGSTIDYTLLAGLTGIPFSMFVTVTGSNGNSGVG